MSKSIRVSDKHYEKIVLMALGERRSIANMLAVILEEGLLAMELQGKTQGFIPRVEEKP